MNVEIQCPECLTAFAVRRELLGKRTRCTKCGAVFVIAEGPQKQSVPRPAAAPASQQPPSASAAVTEGHQPTAPEMPEPPAIRIETEPAQRPGAVPPSRPFAAERVTAPRRFAVLHFVARVYEVLAIFALLAAALFLALFVVAVIGNPGAILAAIIGSGLTVFWAVVAAVMLYSFAQAIRLALEIEQNTREASEACQRLADHLCGIERES